MRFLRNTKEQTLSVKNTSRFLHVQERQLQNSTKKAHFVTCDSYVTMSDGTGIVHIAPAFGEDDSRVGRDYDLPFVQFVDGQGNMTKETPYAGVFVKKADPMVSQTLTKRANFLTHRNSSMIIRTAGDVIHR